jgi:hypothetical protein
MNSAFSTATRPYKQHQSELPPPPDNFKKMLNHPLSAEFKAAAKAEGTEVGKKGTYEKISRPKGVKVLPLRWVFTYKFDSQAWINTHWFQYSFCETETLPLTGFIETKPRFSFMRFIGFILVVV